MTKKTAVAPALVVCCAIVLSAATPGVENPPGAPPPAAVEQQGPKKRDLGNWWEKSSLEYKPSPTRWLFHAAGTLSYMNAAGNTSGNTFDVSTGADVRENRFTSQTYAQLSRKNVTYGFGQGTVNFTERTLREQVSYDVISRLKVVAGIEDYRNTLMFMDKRRNVYGGVGAVLLRNEAHQVTFTGGIGHADFIFDREKMSLIIQPDHMSALNTSPSSGGTIGMQTWHWKCSPRFNFSEDTTYMRYFDSYLGYRWAINLNGNVPINKKISFNVTYRIKEETNTIIKALGLHTQDRMFLMGIRLST